MRYRHGYHRDVALWPTPRGSGGDQVPVDVPGYERRVRRPEIPHRTAEQSIAVGFCSDRTKDAAQSAAERQRVPFAFPVPGRALVKSPQSVLQETPAVD